FITLLFHCAGICGSRRAGLELRIGLQEAIFFPLAPDPLLELGRLLGVFGYRCPRLGEDGGVRELRVVYVTADVTRERVEAHLVHIVASPIEELAGGHRKGLFHFDSSLIHIFIVPGFTAPGGSVIQLSICWSSLHLGTK